MDALVEMSGVASNSLAVEEGGDGGTDSGISTISLPKKGIKQLNISKIRKSIALLGKNHEVSKHEQEGEKESKLENSEAAGASINMASGERELSSQEPPTQATKQPGSSTGPGGETADEVREAPGQRRSPLQTPEQQRALPGAQERRSPSTSTSPSETAESIISLAFDKQSARSSSVDGGVTTAFTSKWGSFLDQILAEKAHAGRRAEPALAKQEPSLQHSSQGLNLSKDIADEAGGEHFIRGCSIQYSRSFRA